MASTLSSLQRGPPSVAASPMPSTPLASRTSHDDVVLRGDGGRGQLVLAHGRHVDDVARHRLDGYVARQIGRRRGILCQACGTSTEGRCREHGSLRPSLARHSAAARVSVADRMKADVVVHDVFRVGSRGRRLELDHQRVLHGEHEVVMRCTGRHARTSASSDPCSPARATRKWKCAGR